MEPGTARRFLVGDEDVDHVHAENLRAHRLGIDHQIPLAHHPQHGQEVIVDPVRRDERTGAGRQRAGEFRRVERLVVHQDGRDAEVGDQVPVRRLGIHQNGHQRSPVPPRPVRI